MGSTTNGSESGAAVRVRDIWRLAEQKVRALSTT
jgi:hypothetical protein